MLIGKKLPENAGLRPIVRGNEASANPQQAINRAGSEGSAGPTNYAFRATATITYRNIPLDHPWLNETPCALPQATASYNPNSVYVASSVLLSLGSGGVNGDQSAWALVRGDGFDIPAGASYHVLVDPQQSRRCTEDLLFVSDIE